MCQNSFVFTQLNGLKYCFNIPQSSSYTATYHPSRKLSKLDEPDMQDTAEEVGTSS